MSHNGADLWGRISDGGTARAVPAGSPGPPRYWGGGWKGRGLVVKGHPAPKGAALNPGGEGRGGPVGPPPCSYGIVLSVTGSTLLSAPFPSPSPPQYRDPAVPRCGSDPRSQLCAGGVVTPGSSRAQMWRRSRDPAVCLASRRRCDPAVPRCGSDAPPPRIQLCAAVMATLGSSCAQL